MPHYAAEEAIGGGGGQRLLGSRHRDSPAKQLVERHRGSQSYRAAIDSVYDGWVAFPRRGTSESARSGHRQMLTETSAGDEEPYLASDRATRCRPVSIKVRHHSSAHWTPGGVANWGLIMVRQVAISIEEQDSPTAWALNGLSGEASHHRVPSDASHRLLL